MLGALDEAGIRPDMVLGTSIGAFNGSVIADESGPSGVRRLTALWNELAGSGMFRSGLVDRVKNIAALRPAIHDTQGLREILQNVHGRGKKIEDLAVRFQCVAASIERSAEHWFTEGSLVEALLASSAIPVLLPPVEVGGEHYYDGGLVNSIPVDRAIELGATTVFALQVGRIEASLRPPARLHEAALISFEIARRHRFSTEVRKLPDEIDFHLLPSGNPVEFDDRRQLKWRDTGDTVELIEGAHQATSEYLAEVGLV